MEELIARVAAAAGIGPDVAQKAVALILGFLNKEGPKEEVSQLLNAIPGANEAVAALPEAGGGGLLGGIMGAFGGGGGLMGLAGQLSGEGLGMGDMPSVGTELFSFAREKAGDELVGAVASKIPGLSQFL